MTTLHLRALCCVLLGVTACAVPAADARVVAKVPDDTSFALVAQVLVRHCGSLDCHGDTYRNLRVYGNEGLRLEATDRPLSPECTTEDEAQRDYESLVALEPEIMTAVVADQGARPERLTFIRKARGAEHHKGGMLTKPGGDIDDCFTSWLAGEVAEDSCKRALPESSCF